MSARYVLHGPFGLDGWILEDEEDGEAVELSTGAKSRRLPDIDVPGFTMKDCWLEANPALPSNEETR